MVSNGAQGFSVARRRNFRLPIKRKRSRLILVTKATRSNATKTNANKGESNMRLALNLEEVSEINIAANCDAKIFEIEFPGEELGEEDAWETRGWGGVGHFFKEKEHPTLPG